jgi:hypothetical protein
VGRERCREPVGVGDISLNARRPSSVRSGIAPAAASAGGDVEYASRGVARLLVLLTFSRGAALDP